MNTLVVDELSDRVVVTLAREKQRNAIDAEMISELHEVCSLVERDPRSVLITGRGDHFAGGADIVQLRERTRDDALRGINRNLFDRIAALPLPTVAAVEGYALGGGAELSYACDIRIASPTAVFGNPEPGLGIIAAAGASYRLPTLIGVSVAKQVLLGVRLLDADAALLAGLVMEIVDDPVATAHTLLDRVAQQAPLALKLTKIILDAPGSHPWADDIAQAVLFDTEDKRRRMTAFVEKRQ